MKRNLKHKSVSDGRDNGLAISQQGRILEAVSSAAKYFLRATPEVWEQNVVSVLTKLSEARKSGRVYVCKNEIEADGRLTVQIRYEWQSNGEQHIFKELPSERHEYAQLGLSRWAQLLKLGTVIDERVDKLSIDERHWNVSNQTKRLLIIPVFVGDEWWGYMGFEDWTRVQPASSAEIDALKAVAIIFAEAIKRKRIEQELNEEKKTIEERVVTRTRELQEKTNALEAAQKVVEQSLYTNKQEKARLTASIHSLSLGFLLTDLNGQVVLFNHAVNDILGPPADELTDGLGNPVISWTTKQLQDKLGDKISLTEQISQCIQAVKEIKSTELEYGKKTITLTFTPIKMIEVDGAVIGVVILIHDITEAKQLQRSRDEFFAVAAHELRTPLTAIKGYSEMIQHYFPKLVEDSEVSRMLADIHLSAVRLIEVVNEYLDASRLELQKVQATKEIFDIVPIVRKVMAELGAQAKEKNLEWDLQIPNDMVANILADRGRVEQVLLNIIGNALKYTKRGGVYVKITVQTGTVEVHVYDTGDGIALQEQPYLFQKFKQLGDRVYAQDINAGTGMGLYISRLIAEAMGAKVYLEKSIQGEGSGFVFQLPAA